MAWILFSFIIDLDKVNLISGDFYWDVGCPSLPFIKMVKEYDVGIDIERIDFNVIESETIYNFEPNLSYGGIELIRDFDIQKNDSIFNLDRLFPGEVFNIISKGFSRDRYVVELHIYPYQYIPKEKILIRLKKIDLNILGRSFERKILNKITKLNGFRKLDMVIVTKEEFKNLFNDFKDGRNLLGIRTEIFTTEWIYRRYDGVDNCEKIRNFIIDAYINLGIEYVLIGGGIDVVPVRMLLSNCYYIGYLPTDLYYADIDGNYDANRNGIFGEAQDSIDGYPDVMVGRLPFSEPYEFVEYLERVFDYETGWNFEGNILFLGSSVTSQLEGFGPIVFEDISNMIGEIQNKKLYYPLIDTLNSLWFGDMELNRQNTISEMNSGYNIIGHIDHSDINYLGTGIIFGNKKIYNTDMDNLSSKNGFLITIGCSPNALDFESFSKGFIKFNGVGIIGNVRTGWTYQWYQINDFFKGIFVDSVKTIGEAWKKIMTGNIYFRSSMVLLGDPSMRIYYKRPIMPVVKFRNELIDKDTMRIYLRDSSNIPLKNIDVIISDDNGFYLQKNTDNTGYIDLSIKGFQLDKIYISFVSNYTFPVIKKITLNKKELELLNVQLSEGKLLFTILNKENSTKIKGFYLETFSDVPKIDSVIERNFVKMNDTLNIIYYMNMDNNIISGELFLFTEEGTKKFNFIAHNAKKGIGLTGYELIEDDKCFIIKNIHITNLSEFEIRNLKYGFSDGTMSIVNYLPPFFDYLDTNIYYLEKENTFIYLGKDTIPISYDFPYDSVLSFNYKPYKNSVIINFKTKNFNKYNIYLNGSKINLFPISSRTYEINDLKPFTKYNVKIVSVSNTLVENKEFPEYIICSNPEEFPNWPVFTEYPDYFSTQEIIDRNSPSISDINNDGLKEIIVSTTNGNVYAIDKNGIILEGFPVNIGIPLYTPLNMYDLNNDGYDEIIVSNKFSNPSLYVLDRNGDIIKTFNNGNGVGSLFTVVINENGNTNLVFGGNDGTVYILNNELNIINTIQIYNVSNISNGFYDSTSFLYIALSSSNFLYFYDLNGILVKTYNFDSYIWGISSTDIDNDGIDEAIITLTNGKIYAVNINSILNNFPVNLNQQILTPPVLGDINNDGIKEIIVITVYGKLYYINKDGTYNFLADIPKMFSLKGVSPLLADIDGDAIEEIIVKSNDGYIYSIENNGKITDGFPIFSGSNDWTTPTVNDIDRDGQNEIIFQDQKGYVHCYSLKGSKITWGTYGLNMQRTSSFERELNNLNHIKEIGLFTKETDIKIYDILGRKIDYYDFKLNLPKFPKGVYFMVKGNFKKKFIKIN